MIASLLSEEKRRVNAHRIDVSGWHPDLGVWPLCSRLEHNGVAAMTVHVCKYGKIPGRQEVCVTTNDFLALDVAEPNGA